MNTAQGPIINHLKLAHHLWDQHLKPSDWALDATCGNGYDAEFLSKRVEKLFCIDIQESAIAKTRKKAPQALFFKRCHSQLPTEVFGPNLRLIVYNLGYLPGGNKALTTQLKTTQKSLHTALSYMPIGCCVSMTFYPGHNEGLNEFNGLLPLLASLDPKSFCVSTHHWINRHRAPILAFILKIN